MLSGKGYKQVYNVSGGIKAWKSKTAVGDPDLGMDLFSGKESAEDILKVAYSLEQGLQEFYVSMERRAEDSRVKSLFSKLSKIEVKHQLSLLNAFNGLDQEDPVTREEFEAMVAKKAMEGGLTTDQYLELFDPDLGSEIEVISLAMSIEAQALDLYQRVGVSLTQPQARDIIHKIADEEKSHLASLGKLMDEL
jgi:rubrerythrin